MLVVLILFITTLCFSLFQFYEFYKNYDYILSFNTKYKKYEYVSTPGFDYIDKSVFDPNDDPQSTEKKWRCVQKKNQWYGVSEYGVVADDGDFTTWKSAEECMTFIFQNQNIEHVNPCVTSTVTGPCDVMRGLQIKNVPFPNVDTL